MDLVHDTLGRLEEVRYPDVPGRERFVLKNVYDAATGELVRRDDATDPLAPSMLWQADAREVDGSLAHATYGTGGVDVLERIDEVAQRRETFGYDGSDRLTSWRVESLAGAFPMRQTVYDFDDVGNLEQVIENALVADTMTYGWGGKPHVLATKNGQAYVYDAKGRQVDGPERTIGFSASDLPKTVQTKGSLGTTTTYTYDAGGTRVRKRTPSEETTYVGGLYERRKALANGPQTEPVFYVPGESAIALQVTYEEATGAERRDVVAEDALGTVSGVIDAAGVVSEKRYYDPYGRKVLADGAAAPANGPVSDVRRGFTGHEEDAESGLTNMRGRMYDPGQRRFVTPDPFVSDPFFGQGLHRYAYVTNNPLRWVDPSGFEAAAKIYNLGNNQLMEFAPDSIEGKAPEVQELTPEASTTSDKGENPTEPQKADGPGTESPAIGPPPPPTEEGPTPGGAREMAMRHQIQDAREDAQRERDTTGSGMEQVTPFVDAGKGFLGGVQAGNVPFGGALVTVGVEAGVIPLNPAQRLGFGVGELFSGLVSLFQGATGLGVAGGGEVLSAGAATPLTAAVAVGSSLQVAGAMANVEAGLYEICSALSLSKGGGGDAQDRMLSKGEIRRLQDAGHDIHELKGGDHAAHYDLYKKPNGEVVVKPKGGRGPGDTTGININAL